MSEETRIHDNADALAEAVAEALIARLADIQGEGRVPTVGLTGGSIASAIHRRIASSLNGFDVDWDEVDFWWGDDRYVDVNSGARNAALARRELLEPLEADPGRVHEVPARDSGMSLEDAAEAYADLVHAAGPVEFDVLFLGIGEDGHVASLFPGRPGVLTTGVDAVAVADSPKPPPERISLTLEALARSAAVWFVASGSAKAEAITAAQAEGEVSQLPARGVRGKSETIWWLDSAAATQLQ